MGKITKYIDLAQIKAAWFMKWVLFSMMLLVVYEVIARYVFKAPTIWGLDLRSMIYAITIMVGLSYTLLLRSHVVVDAFTINLSWKTKKYIDIINFVVFYFPPMGVLTYTMYNLTIQSWQVLERTYTPWAPPVYPLKTLLVIAYANAVLQGVNEVVKDVISLQKGSDEWIKDR